MIQQPPHRFREESFRRYERILLRVQKTYPRPVKFQPLNFSCETIAARIRDSVKALLRSPEWQTELDRLWFQEFWQYIQVAHDGTNVIITKKGQRGADVVETANAITQVTRLVIDQPTLQIIEACCVLIRNGIVTEAVKINNLDATLQLDINIVLAARYPDLVLQPDNSNPSSFFLL